MKVAITTLGCKVNQCDGAEIGQALIKEGLDLVPFSDAADVYIINTCSVTGKTDYQSRQLIRRALRQRPGAAVIVTGCYAETRAEELKKIPGVTLVLGNREKTLIPATLASLRGPRKNLLHHHGAADDENPVPVNIPGHTRAFLKIQDGCNAACAYCIVPAARGPSRSLPFDETKRRIVSWGRAGLQEVVLSGIHLGAYGEDLEPKTSLRDLIRWANRERPLARIRLSSLEPTEIPEDITDYMAPGGILCPHLHIPLQSGDDRILQAMGRPYDANFFHRRLSALYASRPELAIGIDVMAGFPAEDEEAFRNTWELVETLPLAYLHVFPFSARPGTAAQKLPHQVSEEKKKERAYLLRELGQKKKEAYMKRFIGRTLSVLVEEVENGIIKGRADNYLSILVPGAPPGLRGKILQVVVEKLHAGKLSGRMIGLVS